MDAFTYFFLNLGLLNFLLALVGFLLGLWLGYLIWHKYKVELYKLRKEISSKPKNCDCRANEREIAELNRKLEQCSNLKAELLKENKELKNKQLTPTPVKAEEPKPLVDRVQTPPSGNSSEKKFSQAVSSGKMVKDDTLGYLYTGKPEEEDDLTLIKGVAGVLKGKLNEFGIYTFRQIASWEQKTVDEFSERLSFKGRVERDGWLDQAKQFHKEKYGEEI